MLINALCEYYDILASKGKVIPEGYSKVRIDYMICLTPDGDIDEIIEWKEKIDGEDISKYEILPERTQKSAIDLNIIEHRPLYIFGLNYDNGEFTPYDNTNRALKSHSVFVDGNMKFTDGIDSPLVNAYRKFLEKWKPEEQTNNPHLIRIAKNYSKSYFGFCLTGEPDKPLHTLPEIKEKWDEYYSGKSNSQNAFKGQCAIKGELLPIARIHDKIKGINGGQPAGGVIVSNKNDSEISYAKEQSYNSNISEIAMKKYTKALNILLEDKIHKTSIDDLTIVHWAQSADNENLDMFLNFMVFDDKLDDEDMNTELKGIFEHVKNGLKADYESLQLNENVDYYIVGMVPNNSRISVKFMYKEKFGHIIDNISLHQNDMAIAGYSKQIPLWRIINELKIPSPLIADLFKSVIYGTGYPEQLLHTVIKGIKLDSDTEKSNFIKINPIRIGIIKACINRNSRIKNNGEVIKMALDTQNTNPAYLCGRLFAVLEKIQQEASNTTLNKTIRDSYFSSACSTPAVVFPRLMMLAQNHISKLDQYKNYWNSQIGAIVNLLGGEFPQTLTLKEQGMFIIGYYQQMYFKKENNNNSIGGKEDGSN